MKNILSIVFVFNLLTVTFAQTIESKRPKLVVGIVVDQMRYDYLTRFYNKYSDDGFKRIINDGFSAENAHFNYIPTYTAPGHASVYTGTTPSNHGIIGNDWYDKDLKKEVYCVDDDSYTTVGENSDRGKRSPFRMKTTTITDELRMSQNMRGKVIGIGIKDRSAILPAGHVANAAYWYDGGEEGKWITSSFYMGVLPKWVQKFNGLNKVDTYLSQPWDTYYNIESYTESMEDNNPYEGLFEGLKAPVFPYDLPKLKQKIGKELINNTPFGNSFTADFVKAAILGEQLGKGKATDFLAISFSSTDYVGHQFGPDSKEIEDTYIRLDKDLASLLIFLDTKVGKDNYTLFLTADHAAVQVPAYLESLKVPAGYFDTNEFKAFVEKVCQEEFNLSAQGLVENFSNYQLFLNRETLKSNKLSVRETSEILANRLLEFKSVYKTVTASTLQNTNFDIGILNRLQNGYNQKFSGDIMLIPNPSTISRWRTGTTHGSGYNYDSHVPIIFYGKGVKKGNLKRKVSITDIAPTMANLLQISFPNGTTGSVIVEAIEE